MATSWQSLGYFLTDALAAYSENFSILKRGSPVLVALNGKKYSIHISSIHDSGENRENDDEERIQIQKATIDAQREQATDGVTALFIGFFPDGSVFTGWEPNYVFSQNPKKGGSVYDRHSNYAAVVDCGAALRVFRSTNLGRNSVTVSMRTNALGMYLENWAELHAMRDEAQLRALVATVQDAISSDDKTGVAEAEVEISGERKKVTVKRETYARNPKFTKDVLAAYGWACCICERQLGLIQAAHIVPHCHPDSKDDVSNGLALCIEHHKLYDDALLLPRAGAKLHLNPDRVEHLKNIRQDSGLDSLIEIAGKGFKVPKDEKCRPNEDLLEKGLRIRLGIDHQ